ncbi:SOS response-associated peptidase [Alkalihalobacillus deserti]|uniref:SOS response-associated peptidase n=1 Tax=Alkalihalobacillus deserti TaxID=2879466 RepID=UPI001D1346D6|nr:SOS response-associated peptidase [Alkalihalobacillus deserti]
MCGRFTLTTDLTSLQQQFDFDIAQELTPRYNIAPSQPVLTLTSEGGNKEGSMMRWGLIPFWAKDPKIGYKLINARAETVNEKASFKHAFKRRRCLILSDGFYEWQKTGGGKQPYRFVLKERRPFAMAGLYEEWKQGNAPITSCTIITTRPNELTKKVHDRMPVILPGDTYDTWLDPRMDDIEYLKSLLIPYDADKMDFYPVSTLVNSPKNDIAELLSPLNSL